MTTAIIILAYVANVFLNRWLNMVAYKSDRSVPVIPLFWFFSFIATLLLLAIVIVAGDKNWFTGKNW